MLHVAPDPRLVPAAPSGGLPSARPRLSSCRGTARTNDTNWLRENEPARSFCNFRYRLNLQLYPQPNETGTCARTCPAVLLWRPVRRWSPSPVGAVSLSAPAARVQTPGFRLQASDFRPDPLPETRNPKPETRNLIPTTTLHPPSGATMSP